MNTTRAKLKTLRRQAREVTLPGGDTVHVRDLSVAEIRRIDEAAKADGGDDAGEVAMRTVVRISAAALAEPDGSPAFPGEPSAADLAEVEQLSTTHLQAIVAAAIPSKADAKN